jgi:hypothetical protein
MGHIKKLTALLSVFALSAIATATAQAKEHRSGQEKEQSSQKVKPAYITTKPYNEGTLSSPIPRYRNQRIGGRRSLWRPK